MHHFSKIYVASIANHLAHILLPLSDCRPRELGPGSYTPFVFFPAPRNITWRRSSIVLENERRLEVHPKNYQMTSCEKLGVAVRKDILPEVWLKFKLKGTKPAGKEGFILA